MREGSMQGVIVEGFAREEWQPGEFGTRLWVGHRVSQFARSKTLTTEGTEELHAILTPAIQDAAEKCLFALMSTSAAEAPIEL